MKIKIYIVTYKNPPDLNRNLKSIFESDWRDYDVSINVINNHSDFHLDSEYEKKVNIIHNSLRPDWSTGHLARNWNQAIINGFKSLTNPDCDILIHCQDDNTWSKEWLTKLVEIHTKYTFFTGQAGDAMCSYTPEAVRRIGLWDERFCSIGFQEFDYYTRAYLYNKNMSSINAKTNLLNSMPDVQRYFPYRPDRNSEREAEHVRSSSYHTINWNLLKSKWLPDNIAVEPKQYWKTFLQNSKNIKHSRVPNYVFYPYFEKDVYRLKEKNYANIPDTNSDEGQKLAGVKKK